MNELGSDELVGRSELKRLGQIASRGLEHLDLGPGDCSPVEGLHAVRFSACVRVCVFRPQRPLVQSQNVQVFFFFLYGNSR